MTQMLRNTADGLDLYANLRGRSAHGGASRTVVALYRRGLLRNDLHGYAVITEAGLAAIGRKPPA